MELHKASRSESERTRANQSESERTRANQSTNLNDPIEVNVSKESNFILFNKYFDSPHIEYLHAPAAVIWRYILYFNSQIYYNTLEIAKQKTNITKKHISV